jgi:orotate phosphoribosyltransferase
MNQQEFYQFIIDHDVVQISEHPITLKSGKTSHLYVNWRKATSNAYILDKLSDHIVEFVKEHAPDCETIFGVPEGASKVGVIAGLKYAKSRPDFAHHKYVVAMGRGKVKAHGMPEDRLFIGKPLGRTLVIEDTVTSGISLFECVDTLLENNVDVKYLVAITDREDMTSQGNLVANEVVRRYSGKIRYLALSKASTLLPLLFKQTSVATSLKNQILREFPNIKL